MHSAADNERRVICKSGSADSCRFRLMPRPYRYGRA